MFFYHGFSMFFMGNIHNKTLSLMLLLFVFLFRVHYDVWTNIKGKAKVCVWGKEEEGRNIG